MNLDDRRKLWRDYCRASQQAFLEWGTRGYQYPSKLIPLPEVLRGLTCGAQTRAGTPCKVRAIFANGRCKLHGGLSTGPKSEAGKAVSRKNGLKGGRPLKT